MGVHLAPTQKLYLHNNFSGVECFLQVPPKVWKMFIDLENEMSKYIT